MRTTKLRGFFRKAWLCPCLLCLLTSCAALQKPAQEPSRYRVTLAIAPGSNEDQIAAVLADLPMAGFDLMDATGFRGETSIMQFTVPNEQAVRHLQQQLQTAGIAVTGFHIQRIN